MKPTLRAQALRAVARIALAVTFTLGLPSCKPQGKPGDGTPAEAMQPDPKAAMAMEAAKAPGADRAAPPSKTARPGAQTPPEGDSGLLAPREPPAQHAAKLKEIEESIAGTDWGKRSKAKDALQALLKENPKDAALALYLLGGRHYDLITAGIKHWRELRESHAQWVPVLVTLFGHTDDRVRHEAINALWFDAKPEQMEKAIPHLRKALADKSCLVRGLALRTLSSSSSSVQPKLPQELLGALNDECPLMQANAMEGLPSALEGKAPDAPVLERIMTLATTSPFYYVRCRALHALGRMKIAASEKLMAAGLSTPAGTALVVYFQTERTAYTFNMGYSTMPDCAAHALHTLHGGHAKLPDKDLDRVRHWLGEMAKIKLSKAPGKSLCLNSDHCRKNLEICLHMTCTPNAKAEQAYWDLQLLQRCQAPDEKATYKNFGGDEAVQVGLGLHWLAEHQMRQFLQKRGQAAHDKRLEEEKKKPCPAK